MKKMALLIGLLAGSLFLPRQLVADKLEGIILQNKGGVLRILDVVSYEKFHIPITASTKVVRKSHESITVDDLRVGWFIEVEGNKVEVKTSRFEEVKFDGFSVHFYTNGVIARFVPEITLRADLWRTIGLRSTTPGC